MDFSLQHHESFIGRPATDLPTPSLILSKPTLEKNINQLLQDVKDLRLSFRPHVKTLKSLELTRLMLANGTHRRIVASTLSELRGVLPLAKEGILDEALYGLPIYPSALPHLQHILTTTPTLKLLLMIDSPQHIDILESYAAANPTRNIAAWPVFIKIDVGSHRAGVELSSDELPALVRRVEGSKAVELYGFYCHAGHSYACRREEEVKTVLGEEVRGVLEAVRFIQGKRKVVVSVGSTPTAHVVREVRGFLNGGVEVECVMYTGNYPSNDLQQVCTGIVKEEEQALRILAEVCSVYPGRNEALINAGTVALSKETSEVPGFGRVVDRAEWSVARMSQEHGILGLSGKDTEGPEKVEEVFRVGQKVMLYCQHACITAAAHFVYYVVDEEDVVRETWVPWKGW
ncbi:hypothetical protein BO94DRAFT_528515 [Aspergillus sclerotioniger CBS 115572]|uniref:D-serine dehydratase n=1 Tax=Aspergillus sclerotioniger CBS 115572 TaxID=1450535 RepID=A0A317UYI2_9EURO|nr:hypothetical protein BO94DRAFT_528515 [Aspergillus sclerotioniger CBS 115572]PWY66815.1 hypothetical protein BO94DRAFT_528515 [Aspergillus sclerotioniger CBS 115572]